MAKNHIFRFYNFNFSMVYIFTMPKIGLRWRPLQPFLNIDHNFCNICFLKKFWLSLGAKSGPYSSQKYQFPCLAGLIEWQTRVYFCPLFALFKTLLALLTKCALHYGFSSVEKCNRGIYQNDSLSKSIFWKATIFWLPDLMVVIEIHLLSIPVHPRNKQSCRFSDHTPVF